MYRAAQEGAVLLMGSATPSLEAWHHMREGTHAPRCAGRRLSGGGMPTVEVVDMRRPAGAAVGPTPRGDRKDPRRWAADDPLPQPARILLPLPLPLLRVRDDLPPLLGVPDLPPERERWSATTAGSAAPTRACPECGSLDVGWSGFGTEGIEEELAAAFPHLVVRRVDTDSVRERRSCDEALEDFREGGCTCCSARRWWPRAWTFPG